MQGISWVQTRKAGPLIEHQINGISFDINLQHWFLLRVLRVRPGPEFSNKHLVLIVFSFFVFSSFLLVELRRRGYKVEEGGPSRSLSASHSLLHSHIATYFFVVCNFSLERGVQACFC